MSTRDRTWLRSIAAIRLGLRVAKRPRPDLVTSVLAVRWPDLAWQRMKQAISAVATWAQQFC